MKWFYERDQEMNEGRKAEISVMVRSVLNKKNVSDVLYPDGINYLLSLQLNGGSQW